ncbi:hypothetical protein GCM10027043_20030 [Ferruginibacter profundus]
MVVLVSPVVLAQNNINGVWEGKFLAANTDLGEPRLVVEIYNLKDSVFTGVTHLYYQGNKYEHYKMVGSYNKKNGVLMFLEASTIAVDLGIYSNCLGTYTTVLRKDGDKMFQFGYWVSTIKNCSPTTNIWLQKREELIKPAPVENKKNTGVKKPPVTDKPAATPLKEKTGVPVITIPSETPVVKNAPAIKTAPVVMPAKIAQRETDVQSLIEIAPADKDSIKVDVYDNGEIDGDSVSVYEEHMIRVNKKMITAKPITFYVSLDKNVNPIAHLRLVAESLGSIPPCTALMVITTKSKRYEVRLSSNFSKNATVEFFLKE